VIGGAVSLILTVAGLLVLGADILTAIGLGFGAAIFGAALGWVWVGRA
jgi:hypothetical protein